MQYFPGAITSPCHGLSVSLLVLSDVHPQAWAQARPRVAAVVEVPPAVMDQALVDPTLLAPVQWDTLLEAVAGEGAALDSSSAVSASVVLRAIEVGELAGTRGQDGARGAAAARLRLQRAPCPRVARWRLYGLRWLVRRSLGGDHFSAAQMCGLSRVFFEAVLEGHVLLDAQLARRIEGRLGLDARWLDRQGPIPAVVADSWRLAMRGAGAGPRSTAGAKCGSGPLSGAGSLQALRVLALNRARARSAGAGDSLDPGPADGRSDWGVHRQAANDTAGA